MWALSLDVVVVTFSRLPSVGFIATGFVIVLVLEYATPAQYVFGYLYAGAIVLTSIRLNAKITFGLTLLAIGLTLANVWLPAGDFSAAVLVNRSIACLSLGVTGFLSARTRQYQTAIAQQRAKLHAQEQLAQVRENFVSTLTHDLKTPLLGAIETLNAFQTNQFGSVSSTQQTVLATMKRSHQTSLQLVQTLLDVYRNDAEGLSLNPQPIDLAAIAEEVAATLNELAASRQVYLAIHYGSSDFRRSLWVQGDGLQLQRVFANLIINAINHSRRGDRVEVLLQSQASYQIVKVLDTGAGITPDEFPYLFERFYQGQSDRQAGSGLGLYLSRQIIEAHGGTIWAENRIAASEPTGALFGFRLPVLPHPSI
jgi:two-component system, NarL family, sensor kinase